MKFFLLIFISFSLFLTASGQGLQISLAEKYRDYFPVGAAVSPRTLKSADSMLIINQYNSLVGENHTKPMWVQPEESKFSFENSDYIAAFAKRHRMKLRGHTLVWHRQTPDWFFKNDNQPASKEILNERLRKHIETVVSHFRNEVYGWDVVNEAISDERNEYLRTSSPWYQIMGDEYIELAFRYAHKADPEAILFYNDYNACQPEKRDKIIRLVKSLQEKGVPIHGIGMQGHWKIGSPTKAEIETAIDRYAALGLTVQITELDVSVYQSDNDKEVKMTPELEQRQADYYQMCFEVFREKKDKISSVTFWGAADNHTWLDNFPVRGRKNYPLIFDTQLQPKKAFDLIMKFEASPEPLPKEGI